MVYNFPLYLNRPKSALLRLRSDPIEGMSKGGEKTLKATTLFLSLTFEMHKFNFRKVFFLSFVVPWMIRSMMDLMIKFKVLFGAYDSICYHQKSFFGIDNSFTVLTMSGTNVFLKPS